MTAPAYTRHFWAKSDRDNKQRIHLLEHHMADVGACLEALLAQPTIRRRLARSGGRDDLDAATIARLCVFAALHDIGKVNVGFQTRIWEAEDLPAGEARWPGRCGHIADLTPVLNHDDRETAAWFFDALGWDDFLSWDAEDGRTVCALFVAALSHHGSPLNLHDARQRNSSIWRSYGALHPQRQVTRIGQCVREWFHEAWSPGAPALPSAVAFQHLFTGLCMLADWIGSDETRFPFCAESDGDYMHTARANAHTSASGIFGLGGGSPAHAGIDVAIGRRDLRGERVEQGATPVAFSATAMSEPHLVKSFN